MTTVTVAFAYVLEPGDVSALAGYLTQSNPEYRRSRDSLIGWILIFSAVLAVVFGIYEGAGASIFVMVLGSVGAWYYWRTYPVNVARMTQRMYAADPKPGMFDRQEVSFSAEGAVIDNGIVRSDMKWSAFVRWVETAEHLFLFTSALEAVIIPKRSFVGDQMRELLGLFRAHIKAAV